MAVLGGELEKIITQLVCLSKACSSVLVRYISDIIITQPFDKV